MSETPPEPLPVQPPPELLAELAEAAAPGPDPDEAPPAADDGLLTVVVDGPVQSAFVPEEPA
ncbi:hypothetical protein [Streptomyces diastatochromogenes]|uniref:hypothetical protein n=1 Tax=Streptomyces diastatochromogenes TaxID=42236 RepID=UPI0036CA4674